jgi:hypothetical protein
MRIATRVCVAAMAVAGLDLSASAAEVLSPAAPADEKGSAQAQVCFERALSLYIGAFAVASGIYLVLGLSQP